MNIDFQTLSENRTEIMASGTSLQVNDFLPGVAGGDLVPPPGDVGRGEERSSVGGGDQVVGVGKMGKIGEREVIPGQETALCEPLVVHIKHFGKLLFALLDGTLVLLDLHSGGECELEDQGGGRWVKVLSFCLQPLIYGGLGQRVSSVELLVSPVAVFLAHVAAYSSGL